MRRFYSVEYSDWIYGSVERSIDNDNDKDDNFHNDWTVNIDNNNGSDIDNNISK